MNTKFIALAEAIHQGDIEAGVAEATGLAESGTPPLEIFLQCIEPTLTLIGDQFSRLEIFLPEMIGSADVVKAVQTALRPHFETDSAYTAKGRIVIATVSGDLHDIGKNIVKVMLEVNGFEVKDLGVDVSPIDVIRNAREFEADIIALSALMLPSLPYVRDTIEFVNSDESMRQRFRVMVGGGPVSSDWAEEAGADGYGDDAIEAVQVALELMGAKA